MSRDQRKIVARLVEAEQRAAQRDLEYQTLLARRIIQMRAGAEQPVVELTGRQVLGGERDVINPEYAWDEWPAALIR